MEHPLTHNLAVSSFDSLYTLTYMPWTTIALLPVLLWTLDTLSITAMIALLSEH